MGRSFKYCDIVNIVLGLCAVFLFASAVFSYRLLISERTALRETRRSMQILFGVNDRTLEDKEILFAQNAALMSDLKKREALARKQESVIHLQKEVFTKQSNALQEKSGTIEVLQSELGGTKTELERLKKIGGEPLPKDFINSLLQATVRVRCLLSRTDDVENFRAGSGSLLGRYANAGGNMVVMTNAHVVAPIAGTNSYECGIVLGESDASTPVTVAQRLLRDVLDVALLKINEETILEPVSYSDLGVGFCEFRDIELGDRITILSFPGFQGPEHAVSEGEITNVLDGPIYETSAAIDRGSSGGVALLNKKRCLLGMPTWKGVGSRFGLSYIQSWPMILSYVGY